MNIVLHNVFTGITTKGDCCNPLLTCSLENLDAATAEIKLRNQAIASVNSLQHQFLYYLARGIDGITNHFAPLVVFRKNAMHRRYTNQLLVVLNTTCICEHNVP